jgi:hypothetical protein
MRKNLKKQERAAIEAVARSFSATWEPGSNPPDAYLTVAGQRVAVDVATLKRRTSERNAAKPRLRFDKVVIRLMERLQSALSETVPDGMTVLLTVTAPIRLPSKTAESLEDKIQTLLQRGSPGRDAKETIHGNRVQIRILRHESTRAPKIIGFVHNSDSDSPLLLNTTSELLERIGAPTRAGNRWLILITAEELPFLDLYRHIYSHLRTATTHKKVLIVLSDTHVATL